MAYNPPVLLSLVFVVTILLVLCVHGGEGAEVRWNGGDVLTARPTMIIPFRSFTLGGREGRTTPSTKTPASLEVGLDTYSNTRVVSLEKAPAQQTVPVVDRATRWTADQLAEKPPIVQSIDIKY